MNIPVVLFVVGCLVFGATYLIAFPADQPEESVYCTIDVTENLTHVEGNMVIREPKLAMNLSVNASGYPLKIYLIAHNSTIYMSSTMTEDWKMSKASHISGIPGRDIYMPYLRNKSAREIIKYFEMPGVLCHKTMVDYNLDLPLNAVVIEPETV